MTAPARFRLARHKLVPRWLTEGEGELVGYTLDILKDAFVERLRLGLLARFPQNGPNGETPPADAFVALGRDRRVIRGRFETDAAYAARLLLWIDDRYTAGNPFSLMRKLSEYTGPGCAFRTVDSRGNWYSRAADGTQTVSLGAANWNWDGIPLTQWSRFWVIVYPGAIPEGVWGTSTWGDGGAWGTTWNPDEIATFRAIVADWKPAGTICVSIVEALDASSFDPVTPEPDGSWGHWSTWNGTAEVRSRLSTARYWDGV